MANKNGKKKGTRKRKLSNGDEGAKKIEISQPKKMHVDNETKVTAEVLEILPTRETDANQLMACLKQKEFVIIEGPIGCGKSFIAKFAAQELGLSLHSMQMGDQVDSKGLLGAYHTTEVAGQFLWKMSNFSKWLSQPCAILIEDLDMANPDVIALLTSISSSRKVSLPSSDDLFFNDAVVLMATLSGRGKKSTTLDSIPARISLQSLTDADLMRLVAKAFPRASHISRRLTSMFRSVEDTPSTSNSRRLTSSDLLRACARIDKLVDLSATDIFPELVDVWCLADESVDRSRLFCEKIAEPLTITTDQLAFHLNMRQPTLSYDDVALTIGRIKLPRNISLSLVKKHRLGHTRDVLQLMERIAVCVQHCEPVLLVGETGVGKTSVVQSLASLLNVQLKVVNLSPTSDADDLIEGFKPVTIGQIMEPFTHFFCEVLTSNFNREKNNTFLGHLETCLSTGRYKDYLHVVERTALKALAATEKDARWAQVLVRARKIRGGLEKNAAPFALTRGAVLEAAQEGHWLLVDEINLASPECLDAIVHAIDSAHPNFRLFACMNPATDAGKRRLPAGVRTRFTEFFVFEMTDPHQLALLISTYLPSMKAAVVETVVKFYLQAKEQYPASYSLRTLCRALLFAADNLFGSDERNLFEAISMAFLTNLSVDDKTRMRLKISQTFRSGNNVQTSAPPLVAADDHGHIQIEGYWIAKGTDLPQLDSKFVLTKTVKENLAEIARIVSSGRFPILLEGETSAGKTSIVTYLARITGNSVVRINNHEHTDIQEYMGSYVADESGRLMFKEGALVRAVRDGGWVILDELNLAPTDVIEALNRLLDDNRELFVPELNKMIKAHPRFRLFATQNPAGTYSGRKRLSRALLSRFVVLRFHHLPFDELSSMVCTRCSVHPSAAAKMISVLVDLRNKRSLSGLFSARDGLMTLRDVFRWAKRLSSDDKCDDWLQVLANHGYFLLAGRCRNHKDEEAVVNTLETVLRRKIDIASLFAANSPYFPPDTDISHVVATMGMRRMLVMTHQAWLRDEAVLMVGETGGGKTTLAQIVGRGQLLTINCHERTETADLLGRLRPKEQGGFEWSDGVIIEAMKKGLPILVDEISLAEDSVLERLNPLFEENRSLLLSDAGADVQEVVALQGYQMIATMNPGGDYGKKELSKALRNRFTEVWSTSDYTSEELISIFNSHVHTSLLPEQKCDHVAKAVVTWISEFFGKYSHVFRHAPSVRDIVACSDLFSAVARESNLSVTFSLKEAICAVFLDAIASLPTRMTIDSEAVFQDALRMLSRLLQESLDDEDDRMSVQVKHDALYIGPLCVKFGPDKQVIPRAFSLKAPTCVSNFYRIARGLLINKPILLEGAPGCGKSSTVMALAQLTGHPITRLNLSDQTDLSDLFGTDVPIVLEDGNISFKWEDGPILRAIKRGEWVLLDEMNLASQSVLEGLNACFDHRRILFIAELNKSFEIPVDSKCRFFACQNPRAQGGNRRALPKSFVNRFTNIWVDDLTSEDITLILKEVDSNGVLSDKQARAMVDCNVRLADDDHLMGGPFSFNLRDLLRWLSLYSKSGSMSSSFHLLYLSRMRREEDRKAAVQLYEELFGERFVAIPVSCSADENSLMIGQTSLHRTKPMSTCHSLLLSSNLTVLSQIASCVDMNWLTLLIGSRNAGKRSAVETLANMTGNPLHTIRLTSETDAQELIGSYEQVIDGRVIDCTKMSLLDLLSPSANSRYYSLLENANTLTELESALELLFSEVVDAKVIEECRDILEFATKNVMKFEWIDSTFVKAYLEGHWVLLEDVNLCSGAVLDRLNCCLESDGKLVISERQSSFEPLEAHPNFRVFMSMDSKNGEVSRAMRNRSVEIFISNEQNWSSSPLDLISMCYNFTGKNLSSKTAESISGLPAERQLYFVILLGEFGIYEACRCLSIDLHEQWEDDSIVHNVAPRVADIDDESFVAWQTACWKGDRENILERIMLWMLSASKYMLNSRCADTIFESSVSEFVQRALSVIQAMPDSKHPLDCRFNGGRMVVPTVSRYVVSVVCEWALQTIKAENTENGSAEHMSKTLSKYELHTNENCFKNVPLISAFIAESIRMLREASFNASSEEEAIRTIFSLLLLIQSCRVPLQSRSGSAPIYIAWNQFIGSATALSSSLRKIVELMKLGWSTEAHELFISQYLRMYDAHRLLNPFDTEDDNNSFLSILEESITREQPKDASMMETDDVEDTTLDYTSVIAEPLILVNRMHNILRLFEVPTYSSDDAIFHSQKPLGCLKWREDGQSLAVQVISLLNSEFSTGSDRVINIHRVGAFNFVYLSLWSTLQFDPSLSLLSIEDLRHFVLTTITNQLWRLAPNSALLSSKIRGVWENCGSVFEGWSAQHDPFHWTSRVDFAFVMLQNALPPIDTLDPVVFKEELHQYYRNSMSMVSRQLDIIGENRFIVSRQLSSVSDSLSSHPLIKTLFCLRDQLEFQLIDQPGGCSVAFRQKACQYNELCDAMRSFLLMVNEILPILKTLDDLNISTLNPDAARVKLAQLSSFINSAVSFRQSCLLKYSSFIDISMTFLVALDILLTAIHEACFILESHARRKEITLSSAFPPMFNLTVGKSGIESSELLSWCSRDASPMPLALKAAVVRQRLLVSEDVCVLLEWTRKQWQKWYEKNIAKAAEKDFVYRSKTEEEKDELDVIEFFSKEEQDREVLPSSDISMLLDATEKNVDSRGSVTELDRDTANIRYSLALLWIRNALTGMNLFPENLHHATSYADLSVLSWLSSQESSGEVIDVYRSSSVKEYRKATDLLESLTARTSVVLNRWPEVVPLKLILTSVKEFMKAPVSNSQIKMATLIENIIEQCEEWEKIADRENSLREQLAPLRVLLVEWKKMEVRSWATLLDRSEFDSRQRAQLVAYPLFDALSKTETTESSSALIAMTVDWLQNSTLIDFTARISSVISLAEWAQHLGKVLLAFNLRSVASHFSQYIDVVKSNLKESRDPAANSLKDYLKIVKYNDLNLWNIKVASQKAHTHLFKIIRKFRDAVGFEVSPHFDSLLNIEKWKTPKQAIPLKLQEITNLDKRTQKAQSLAQKIAEQGIMITDVLPLIELSEQITECDQSLRTMINYDQFSEDKEKEKAQGYARNIRQRDVALVIKESQVVGLNARKAMTLNQEKITHDSIAAVQRGSSNEELVRVCAGGRNAAIRKANKPSDQLGVATKKHFSGMIEYGMHWILRHYSVLTEFETLSKKLKGVKLNLGRVQSNIKAGWFVDHTRLHQKIEYILNQCSELTRISDAMSKTISMVPDSPPDHVGAGNLHPLSLLHRDHSDLPKLIQCVSHFKALASDMLRITISLKKDESHHYERSAVETAFNQLFANCNDARLSVSDVEVWFDKEAVTVVPLLEAILSNIQFDLIETSVSDERITDATGICLFIQDLYKSLVEPSADSMKLKTLERFEKAVQALSSCGIEKVISFSTELMQNINVGLIPSASIFDDVVALIQLSDSLYTSLVSRVALGVQVFCVLYHSVLSLSMQLSEKGYVNTIPKADKQESGDGKTDESGEGGGMGEGKSAGDAKDVTDEMEETGQIEGLQDDEQEDPAGEKGSNETPIEMDEDFAEDLQDIDKNEDNGNEDEDDKDDEDEANPEDQMGEVEDQDETQLDPKLWDDEEKDEQQKDMDQDDKGADNKTDNLAAKEDDPLETKADETENENNTPEENKEDDDGLENADERDREDKDDDAKEEEKEHETMDADRVDSEPDMEENIGDIDDATDEEGETDPENTNNEEQMETEDIEPEGNVDEDVNNPTDDVEDEKEEGEAMEQGTGGERREQDTEEEGGGLNEDENEEKKEEETEGKGQSKSDDQGDEGVGQEAKQKEEDDKEKENDSQEEPSDKERELAVNDDAIEDAEEGKGEENESGGNVEDAPAAQKQMIGAGSMEEARQTKKEDRKELERKKKTPLIGAEEQMDVPADELHNQEENMADSAIHLAADDMFSLAEEITKDLILGDSTQVEEKSTVSESRSSFVNAEQIWLEISRSVNILSAELAENLRLILEPQRANKMQGDYRSGKRLNMRRLIPYIASDYRKDRIWMRRTKRAQRDYQVLIAVDDSASMNENGIHKVTCESVCTIDDALRRCDAGAVSVCSFGSSTQVLCAFGDQMVPGPDLLQKLTFSQDTTDLLSLLNCANKQLTDVKTPSSEQLLIIISDGRGALSQGADKVRRAISSLQGVTVLFVILDSGPKSITELSVASFQGGNVVLTPYLSLFPFPFYAVVKSIHQLPAVLSESIRQWFELSVQSMA